MAEPTHISAIASTDPSNPMRRLAECYKRGLHLATCEKNYDYAHVMFAECVLNDPGNLQFVDAMVQNLQARTPFVEKWHLHRGGSRLLKKALQHHEWTKVLRMGVTC